MDRVIVKHPNIPSAFITPIGKGLLAGILIKPLGPEGDSGLCQKFSSSEKNKGSDPLNLCRSSTKYILKNQLALTGN